MSKRKTQQFTYSGRSDYSIEYDYSRNPPTIVALYQGTTILDPDLNSNIIKSSEAKQAVISSLKSVDITKGNALAANTNWDPTFDPSAKNTYTSNSSQNTQIPGIFDPNNPNSVASGLGLLTNFASGFSQIAEITSKKNKIDDLFQKGTFIYPEDLLMPEKDQFGKMRGQDYCKITVVKYDPPNKDQLLAAGTNAVDSIIKSGLVSQNDAGFKKAESQIGDKLVGAVYLPMPNKLSDVNEVTWGESAINPLTAVGLGAAIDTAGSLGTGTGIGQALLGLTDPAFRANLVSEIGTRALKSATAGLVDVSPADFLARTTGTIGNPNAELLFRGVKMRQFNFEWSFFPRSESEATIVRQIIRFFKQNSAPSRGSVDDNGQSANGTLVFAPNSFFVQFKNGKEDLKSVFKMKKAALTSMNVTYTPAKQWQSVDDQNVRSQPIGMILQATFTELVPIYQNDYSEFGSEIDDIGY